MRKELWGGMAIFFLAAFIGYWGEQASLEASSVASRGTTLKIISRILENLSTLMEDRGSAQNLRRLQFRDLPPIDHSVEMIITAGIMAGFPDGTFRPHAPLTRGEGLEIFGRLLEFIQTHLARTQEMEEKKPVFEDVGIDHWLQPALGKLGGIGVPFFSQNRRLYPADIFTLKEAQEAATAMLDYFRNELLVGEILDQHLRILPKGTLSPLDRKGWKYCWASDSPTTATRDLSPRGGVWGEISADGLIPLSHSYKGILPRLFLAHEQFQPLEIPPFSTKPGTMLFFKLLPRPHFPVQVAEPVSAVVERTSQADACPDPDVEMTSPEPQPKKILSEAKAAPIFKTLYSEKKNVELAGPALLPTPPRVTVSESETPREASPPMEEVAASEPSEPDIAEESSREDLYGTPPAEKDTLYGVVVNSASRKGIPGATILAGPRQIVTDDRGRFVIPQVHEAILEMTIYGEGCESLFLKHRIGYKPGPLIVALNSRHAILEGRVEDASSGQPIAGAVIKVGERLVRTDPEGKFKVAPLPQTYHQLSCKAVGFMDIMELLFLESRETFKILRLNPLPKKNLSDAVIEPPGQG